MQKKHVWAGLLALVAVSVFVGWLFKQEMTRDRPIQQVIVSTQLKQLDQNEINQILKAHLADSFWQVDLTQIQSQLTRLDWVSKAQVKRNWPDQLVLTIEEQTPVARWGDDGLINHKGDVFFPASVEGFEQFVQLNGPLDQARAILDQLAKLQSQLDTLDWTIEQLTTAEEGSWQVSVLNGPSLLLPKTEAEARLARFIRAVKELDSSLINSAERVDLRYSNGFALKQNAS